MDKYDINNAQVLLNVTVRVATVSGDHSLINDARKSRSPCATVYIYDSS